MGGILSKDTGYQGSLWGAGVTVGYQLPLSRSFFLDFNLGLGYTRLEYDRFNRTDGVRIFWAALFLVTGCDVKDPIYNTPHPDYGKITLTTD